MTIPFVEAKWYTPTSGRKVDLLVIHAMQAPEKGTTAEAVARFFQAGTRQASAHYCHDDNSTVQCVRERDVAWAAPGANHNGVHLELAGFSEQTAREWADAFSSKMLREQAGPIAASICSRYSIPIRYVDAAGLRANRRGITTHNEVSQAFKRSTHWDPGPSFPMGSFVKIVAALAGPQEEDDMTVAELHTYFSSDKGQAVIREAVRSELRAGFGGAVEEGNPTVRSFTAFVVESFRTLLAKP